jgi:hypothetical protein
VRVLGYDLHIVRTPDWTDAADAPILKDEVASLVEADPELSWSSTEFVDSVGDGGEAVRLPFIKWLGTSCFLWDRNQILCTNADERHIAKLTQIADALNAKVVGDDGERYTLRRGLFGKPKIETTKP